MTDARTVTLLQSEAPSNPDLVAVTRAADIESRHRGALAVCGADGALIGALGDVDRPVFPRSAIKLIQALPLIESGAAERSELTSAEIALACASHISTPDHVATAQRVLEKIGLGDEALACGPHWPLRDEDKLALAKTGHGPTRLHNNCSGKHVGLLAACLARGYPVEGYHKVSHPIQQDVRGLLQRLCGVDLSEAMPGIDGCALPTWPIPLAGLARGFALLASGQGAGADKRETVQRLLSAVWSAPEMVAGPGELDTQVLGEGRGLVYIKAGAEGVYCGLFTEPAIGFALKIDDGAKRASETAVLELLAAHDDEAGLSQFAALRHSRASIRNWAGTAVGRMQATGELASFARSLPLV